MIELLVELLRTPLIQHSCSINVSIMSDEMVDCPLCMEPLELDDINFFPCTCGYQICRFCWHRIRTDENGLCPACRKQYPEDPAQFKPLSDDELLRIKKERKQKDIQRKCKAAENRKHLANVRVVQKNLLFVIGLSQRLADAEVLKKSEYFGKYGKIHKVVINQSSSYVGTGNSTSASAYVTYQRSEDALKAIQSVTNVQIDGRTLKASLGTTKYCSHFLRGLACPKQDCMYLHELGEDAASFTKEEMQQGLHTEYEQRLYEQFMNSQNILGGTGGNLAGSSAAKSRKKGNNSQVATKDVWLGDIPNSSVVRTEKLVNGVSSKKNGHSLESVAARHCGVDKASASTTSSSPSLSLSSSSSITPPLLSVHHDSPSPPSLQCDETTYSPSLNNDENGSSPPSLLLSASVPSHIRTPFTNPSDSMSLFSSMGFSPRIPVAAPFTETEVISGPEISETLPISTSTVDWQAAFGFGSTNDLDVAHRTSSRVGEHSSEDDLGFDPWGESSKGLADLMKNESTSAPSNRFGGSGMRNLMSMPPPSSSVPDSLAAGFHSLGLNPQPPSGSVPPKMPPKFHLQTKSGNSETMENSLRALLPNINISFGSKEQGHIASPGGIGLGLNGSYLHHNGGKLNWVDENGGVPSPVRQGHFNLSTSSDQHTTDWDPAIVTAGNVTDPLSESPPHWMASLHNLTDDQTFLNHRHVPQAMPPPHVHHPHHFGNRGWRPAQPPPGFHVHKRNGHHNINGMQSHKLSEGLQ